MSTIPLAKPLNIYKLDFPVLVSIKYDGVPVRIDIDGHGNWTVQSRQGKDVPAVHTLVDEFVRCYTNPKLALDCTLPVTLVGEVLQRGNRFADFKKTSGVVRKQTDQADLLEIHLFECDMPGGYEERYNWMEQELFHLHPHVHVVEQELTINENYTIQHIIAMQEMYPKAEGFVIRNSNDPWAPGKRSWGYQRYLIEPTIDLRIVGFEEAIDKHGRPKNMVGGLIAEYKGEKIGIGPGKLTHQERIELWDDWCACAGIADIGIAQIKYKKDDSYDAPRQATFQFWRADKGTPDA